jgi:hypothetical protein
VSPAARRRVGLALVRTRGAGLAAAIVLAGGVLAGCGVPLETEAQPLPTDVEPTIAASTSVTQTPSPTADSPTPSPTDVETVTARLWFVGDSGLVPVAVLAPRAAGAQGLLDLLAAGPGESGAARGLRTVVSNPTGAGSLVEFVSASGEPPTAASSDLVAGIATVKVSEAFSALPPAEQVLVIGQVVLTLTGAGADAVEFTDTTGTPLAVPLPDGRLLEGPATARDYLDLVARA